MRRYINALWPIAGFALAGCSTAQPPPQACTPPRAHWVKPHNFHGLMPQRLDVSLGKDGALHWDGKPIADQTFDQYLGEARRLPQEPEVFLEAEIGVSCARLEWVRGRMETRLECRRPDALCAEGILSVWRELPNPPGAPPS